MENTENMPRPEIIMVADTVAREKNIERDDVFVALCKSCRSASRNHGNRAGCVYLFCANTCDYELY